MGNQSEAAYPSLRREHPPDERKEGDNMVTYSDMIQFCILLVALVGLCVLSDFQGNTKIAATTTNSDGCSIITVIY